MTSLDGVAGGTDENATPPFEDAGSLQTFDDGSTLATSADGNDSATPATDTATAPVTADTSSPEAAYGLTAADFPQELPGEENAIIQPTLREDDGSFYDLRPGGSAEELDGSAADRAARTMGTAGAEYFAENPTAGDATLPPVGAIPSDDFQRAALARGMETVRGNPENYLYNWNSERIHPYDVDRMQRYGAAHTAAELHGNTPTYLQNRYDPVTEHAYQKLHSTNEVINSRPGNVAVRGVAGGVAGVALYEGVNLALPYAQRGVDALDQNGYTGTAAAIRETGNVANDFLKAYAPVGSAVSAGLQAAGMSQRYADWSGIAADMAVRVIPATAGPYNLATLGTGAAYASYGAADRQGLLDASASNHTVDNPMGDYAQWSTRTP